MSSSATSTKLTTARGGSDTGTTLIQQSNIYKGIVTPIIFVSFLLSLVWVDIRYTLKRSQNRGHDRGGGWMPGWLHSIVYRRSPYQCVPMREQSTPSSKDEQGDFYYHSKQKKLMHTEVDDAFEVRRHVLVMLGLFLLAILWVFWVLSSWLWRSVLQRGL